MRHLPPIFAGDLLTMHESSVFEFFISEKNGLLVVSLIGGMDTNVAGEIRKLLSDVLERSDAESVIFNLRDVNSLSAGILHIFSEKLTVLRESGIAIRFCGMRPEFKIQMQSSGVAQSTELFNNLQAAIGSLKK